MTWSGFLKLGSNLRFWAWNVSRSADSVSILLCCSILSSSGLAMSVAPLPLCISVTWYCVVFNSEKMSVESSSVTTPGTVGKVACVGLDVVFTDLKARQRWTQNRTKSINLLNNCHSLLLVSGLKLFFSAEDYYTWTFHAVKGIVYPNIENLTSFTHHQVLPNPYVFLFVWNRKRDVLQNVHAALLHTTKMDGDQRLQVSKKIHLKSSLMSTLCEEQTEI